MSTDDAKAIRQHFAGLLLEVAENYEQVAARTAAPDVRRFLLKRAEACREAAQAEEVQKP